MITNSSWQWLKDSTGPLTWLSVLGIMLKVLLMLAAFNLCYLVANPLHYGGLPTLYNWLVPGRLRMVFIDHFYPDAYGVNELKLPRILSDHIIARASEADSLRLVVLGSSEVWGYLNRPGETMPVILDGLHLQTQNQHTIRSFNLAYVQADIFKDLMLAHFLIEFGYHPDVLLLVVNPYSFQPALASHFLVENNPEVALEVAQHYGLNEIPMEAVTKTLTKPGWQRRNFFEEREHLAYWLMNQSYAFSWAATGIDVKYSDEYAVQTYQLSWAVSRPGVLEALAALSHQNKIPLLVMAHPMKMSVPGYQEWLRAETARLDLPLLDCVDLLQSSTWFTNTPLHITAEGHRALAYETARWLIDTRTARFTMNAGLPLVEQILPELTNPPDGTCTAYFPAEG